MHARNEVKFLRIVGALTDFLGLRNKLG